MSAAHRAGPVLGFLSAARKGEYEIAVEYLNTITRGPQVVSLSRQLQVVLDHGLPATLNQISIAPEGSQNYGIDPNLDLVGTITTAAGDVDITVERVNRPNTGPVWLFSKKTLAALPDLYEQVDSITIEERLPRVLSEVRIVRVPLYEWLALLVGLPLTFLSTVVLNRVLSVAAGYALRRMRRKPGLANPPILIGPIRLLVVAGIIRLSLSRVILPLLARQAWAAISFVIAIVGCAWLVMKLNGWGERAIIPRIEKKFQAGGALLRFGRRGVDLLVMLAALIVMLH